MAASSHASTYAISVNLQRRNLSKKQQDAMRETDKAIAAELKAEGQTQKQIAAALGVDRTTVARWITPNVQAHNTDNAPPTDNRRKLTQADKEAIFERAPCLRKSAMAPPYPWTPCTICLSK